MLQERRIRRGPDLYAIYWVEYANRGFLRYEDSQGRILQRPPPHGHGHNGSKVPLLIEKTSTEVGEVEGDGRKPKFEF